MVKAEPGSEIKNMPWFLSSFRSHLFISGMTCLELNCTYINLVLIHLELFTDLSKLPFSGLFGFPVTNLQQTGSKNTEKYY